MKYPNMRGNYVERLQGYPALKDNWRGLGGPCTRDVLFLHEVSLITVGKHLMVRREGSRMNLKKKIRVTLIKPKVQRRDDLCW